MKLLLDEMISPRIARELRDLGHDAEAVKKGRPDLASLPDREIVRRISEGKRAIVTDNVKDFLPIHNRIVAAGGEHYGMLFTFDSTLPRSRGTIGLWVSTLDEFLKKRPADDGLRNRVHHLP